MLEKKEFWRAVRKRPAWLLLPFFESGLLNSVRDDRYLKLQYWAYTGKKLHLNPPVTFNEKIAWLKMHDRRDIYRILADKYAVRQFVEKYLDETWLVPLLGVWDSVEAINLDDLPDAFVMKCTHGYGGTVLCRDKRTLDFEKTKMDLKKVMNTDFYGRSREWAYYQPKPKVIAEALIDDGGGSRPADYKFMCFNGKIEFICISRGLGDFSRGAVSFYYPDGSPAPFKRKDYPNYPEEQGMPQYFETMKRAAELLAEAADVPFVRIDFYEAKGKVYFSEFTFYPCGGTMFLDPPQYDGMLGNLLQLSLAEPVRKER